MPELLILILLILAPYALIGLIVNWIVHGSPFG